MPPPSPGPTCYRAIFLFFLLLGLNWPSGARSMYTDRRHGRDGMARQTEQDFKTVPNTSFSESKVLLSTDFTFGLSPYPHFRTLITAAFSSNCVHLPSPASESQPQPQPSAIFPGKTPLGTTGKRGGGAKECG